MNLISKPIETAANLQRLPELEKLIAEAPSVAIAT